MGHGVVHEYKVAWVDKKSPLRLYSRMVPDAVRAKRYAALLEKKGHRVTVMSRVSNRKGEYTWKVKEEFSGRYLRYAELIANPLMWVVAALLAFSAGRVSKSH